MPRHSKPWGFPLVASLFSVRDLTKYLYKGSFF